MKATETTPLQVNRPEIDVGQEPIRDLFELLARYVATAFGAYWTVVALGKLTVISFPALSQHPKSVMVGLLVLFLVLLAGLNSWLTTTAGQRARQTIGTYAYPIILMAGLWGGYKYSEFDLPRTDQGRRYEAALSACMEQPFCVRRMQEKAP